MKTPTAGARNFAALRRLADRIEHNTRHAIRADAVGKAATALSYQLSSQSAALQAELIARRHHGLDLRRNHDAYHALPFDRVCA